MVSDFSMVAALAGNVLTKLRSGDVPGDHLRIEYHPDCETWGEIFGDSWEKQDEDEEEDKHVDYGVSIISDLDSFEIFLEIDGHNYYSQLFSKHQSFADMQLSLAQILDSGYTVYNTNGGVEVTLAI